MNDYDFYVNILKERLSPYRLHHSLEVAKSAKHLAEKYGYDAEKAYLAGLLHDITKEADAEETFAMAEKYTLDMTQLERDNKKLWHAITGAGYIQNELNITDDEILTAVRYHTTGRADMSLGEKVLFIADFVSSDRSYDGVDSMREKAEISLESAMLEGIEFTVTELVEKHSPVHPDTIGAYNDIITNYKQKGLI
ncbi:MAG: bis(5'-nucleosyl)-tetraphosphatase (symmetrical) YqeK [Clostridia bacterium]|nr:bis(5'-nucleosyl)-tetraphosphatase (symmetrical) YqeK [Clostridia bacterium]